MMKAGTYYVGDLCYVMHAEWDEVCGFICSDTELTEGEFTLKSGVKFACYGTMYGDGWYHAGNYSFGVDSGTLGCILLSDIDLTNPDNNVTLGSIIKFDDDFETSNVDGVISIGHLNIDTDEAEVIDEDLDDEIIDEDGEDDVNHEYFEGD